MSGRRAAFIDRDGVVNELVPDPISGLPESPLRVEDVALIPGAAAALRRLAEAGMLLVGVSNQPAAAKGLVPLERLTGVQECVLALLSAEGVRFDDFRICFHHPRGVVAGLTRTCGCRKPAPGMLLEATAELGIDAESSWMIGDTDADVLAGVGAGCHTMLVRNRGSAHKRGSEIEADVVAPSLSAAADTLLNRERVD